MGRVADRMKVKEQPEERDGVVRQADSVGSWVRNHPGNKDGNELRGKPVRELLSRSEFGQRERIFGFKASQGENAKDWSPGDDAASKEAGNISRP